MPLSGICQGCGEVSHALQICTYCGARVCIECIDSRTHACKLCKGGVTRE